MIENYKIKSSQEKDHYIPVSKPLATVILLHGAGAGNQHEFIKTIAVGLAKVGIEVLSFNFPYMQAQYETGKKRAPNTNIALQQFLKDKIEDVQSTDKLFIVGKSMGGRIATQVIADVGHKINGVVALGYPFIPPGKPDKLQERISHFIRTKKTPILILQGERDTFGNINTIKEHYLTQNIELKWIPQGDHSFIPLKRSEHSIETNMNLAVQHITSFIYG